ncbi:hypothetical protein ANN_09810 [Periplaneta americana]|uniref:PHD-type domain-containing protein n=1 Tax=Periplaneta americana TaxID=6978 RepID=A0ABQ8TP34_PERAM|nr:hypothetical protein ANN_09810 [Periplaneta americana]
MNFDISNNNNNNSNNNIFNDAVSTTRLFSIDEIGNSEMRQRIRHTLPDIHLTVGENLGKTQPDEIHTVTHKRNETTLGRRKLKFYSAVHSISTCSGAHGQKFLKCVGPCGLRFHLDCLNMSEVEYDFFMKGGISSFKCDECTSAAKAVHGDNTPVKPTKKTDKKIISPTRELELPNLQNDSTVALSNNVDSDGFQTVTRKKFKKRDPKVGTLTNSNLEMAPERIRTKSLFVSRFSPNVNENNIKDSLFHQRKLRSLEITKLKTKYQSYSSFHISVDERDFELINNSDVWPAGCLIAPFFGKLKPEQHFAPPVVVDLGTVKHMLSDLLVLYLYEYKLNIFRFL